MQKTVREIAEILSARVIGNKDVSIFSYAGIEDAKEGQLTFFGHPKYEKYLLQTKASAILVKKGLRIPSGVTSSLIVVDDPYFALAKLLRLMESRQEKKLQGISPKSSIASNSTVPSSCYVGDFSFIAEDVIIGENTLIYPFCYIGKGVCIGNDTVIYPHTTIYPGVKIGDRCILHAGCVLGADGFGFVPTDTSYEKIPQMGSVVLGNDVEVGACTCVDRAVMDRTIISNGVKLDNLVQVGHNCSIGENTVISAQTGLAGSTHLGRWVRVGGQVGFAGHCTIEDEVEIGAQSGIMSHIKKGEKVLGTPHQEMFQTLRIYSLQAKLPEMQKDLQQLKKEIKELRESCNNRQ